MPATTEKTVHYALPMLGVGTGVTGSTTHTDSADTTIFLPETTSRTIKQVVAEIMVRTNEATAASPSGVGCRFSCNAGTNWTALTKTMTYTNSGENFAFVFTADVTAEFTARFGTGASGTCRWGFYLNNTGNLWMGASCILHITYEYDHTAHSTRLRSALIPFESTTTATTTTLASIGSSQWPNLDTLCPEASKVFRQTALVLDADYVTAGTTDSPLALRMGTSEAETAFGTYEASLRSDGPVRCVWIRNDLATNAAHQIQWRHTAGGAFNRAGGYIIVNYEYDASAANDVLVSVQVPISLDVCNTNPLTGDNMVDEADFWVQEAGLTLVQSAVQVHVNPGTGTIANCLVAVGGQSYRTYAVGSANQTDRLTITQRLDSGGAQGSGLSLARGRNLVTLKTYANSASRHAVWGGVAFLNYTCDKPSAGDQVCNRTLWYAEDTAIDGGTATDQNTIIASPVTPSIIEAAYFLSNVSSLVVMTNSQATYMGVTLAVERASGEGPAAGWQPLGAGMGITPNERHTTIDPIDHTHMWRRWPGDTRYGRLNIETVRGWRSINSQPVVQSILTLVTLHNHTYTKSGTVSDYVDADGAGLTVEWYWENPERTTEKCGESTTTTGGAFTFLWHDDTVNMWASVREDATHVGRSERGTS